MTDENGHHEMDDGPMALVVMSLKQDAELLGILFRALKAEGIPASAAGEVVARFYARAREDITAGRIVEVDPDD